MFSECFHGDTARSSSVSQHPLKLQDTTIVTNVFSTFGFNVSDRVLAEKKESKNESVVCEQAARILRSIQGGHEAEATTANPTHTLNTTTRNKEQQKAIQQHATNKQPLQQKKQQHPSFDTKHTHAHTQDTENKFPKTCNRVTSMSLSAGMRSTASRLS